MTGAALEDCSSLVPDTKKNCHTFFCTMAQFKLKNHVMCNIFFSNTEKELEVIFGKLQTSS